MAKGWETSRSASTQETGPLLSRHIRTLVVDDHPDTTRAICKFLETQSTVEVVATAESGAQALELIERLQPDLVLLDLFMPKVTGVDVAHAARERWPSVRIIMISILEGPQVMKAALASGCDGFAAKERLCSELPREIARIFSGYGEVILLVDDDDAVRELVQKYLHRTAYVILEAKNAFEALLVSRACAGPIKLLLTDMKMPDLNGRELAAQIISGRPNTRVVFMSGETNPFPENGIPLLQKPFTASELVSHIQQALHKTGELYT